MGLQDYTEKENVKKTKSVKPIHLCQSVIQTMYDIIKAHGGEIKVESKENEGSKFIIQISGE